MRLKHFFIGCILFLTANSAQAVGFAKVGTSFGSWDGLTTSARFSALGGADLADGTPSALVVNPAQQELVGDDIFDSRTNTAGGVDDTKTEGNSVDIGTTMGWVSVGETSSTSLKAVVSSQNVGNASYNFDEREVTIPTSIRLGLTFATALRNSGQNEDKLKFLIAYSHVNPSCQNGTDHIGAEMVLYNLLAMRYGYNTR